MKPTKNRVFCKECSRVKMLFETEKKAQLFMKFNNEEIAAENGHAPTRAYFCESCGRWHLTHIAVVCFNGKDKFKSARLKNPCNFLTYSNLKELF